MPWPLCVLYVVETKLTRPCPSPALPSSPPPAPIVGERVCVVGCGLIGLLVLAVAAGLPLTELRAVDPLPSRRAMGLRVGATVALDPASAVKGASCCCLAQRSISMRVVSCGGLLTLVFTLYRLLTCLARVP
jgi:Zn-dependent alcohol dehydrogenase